jgi:hypothetical protein
MINPFFLAFNQLRISLCMTPDRLELTQPTLPNVQKRSYTVFQHQSIVVDKVSQLNLEGLNELVTKSRPTRILDLKPVVSVQHGKQLPTAVVKGRLITSLQKHLHYFDGFQNHHQINHLLPISVSQVKGIQLLSQSPFLITAQSLNFIPFFSP